MAGGRGDGIPVEAEGDVAAAEGVVGVHGGGAELEGLAVGQRALALEDHGGRHGELGAEGQAQQTSGALAAAFERGDPNADLARVMVASQQSQLAFRATVEVRNRLVQAYQDVMNMPL